MVPGALVTVGEVMEIGPPIVPISKRETEPAFLIVKLCIFEIPPPIEIGLDPASRVKS